MTDSFRRSLIGVRLEEGILDLRQRYWRFVYVAMAEPKKLNKMISREKRRDMDYVDLQVENGFSKPAEADQQGRKDLAAATLKPGNQLSRFSTVQSALLSWP
jgi:hypothetical protein